MIHPAHDVIWRDYARAYTATTHLLEGWQIEQEVPHLSTENIITWWVREKNRTFLWLTSQDELKYRTLTGDTKLIFDWRQTVSPVKVRYFLFVLGLNVPCLIKWLCSQYSSMEALLAQFVSLLDLISMFFNELHLTWPYSSYFGRKWPLQAFLGAIWEEEGWPSRIKTRKGPSVQHARNTKCEECHKWRLVYSRYKLTSQQRTTLSQKIEEFAFSCGCDLEDLGY